MDRREISDFKFDDGFSSLVYDEHDENHPPHPQSNRDRQQVFKNSTTPWRHCRLTAVSLSVLAAVLLIVNISLWVHYTNLTRNDTEDIAEELAKLQLVYKTADMEGAKKQLDSELSRQMPTNWELEHQTRRRKDYEAKLDETNKNIAAINYNLPLIIAGCTHCTPGWILMNSMCYYVPFSDKNGKSWQSAREYCQVHGGDLAVLDSKDKENTAVNFLMTNKEMKSYMYGGFWIGLRHFPKEGTWKWVDGRALVEGYWNDGEPGYSSQNNCGSLNAKENFFKAWHDVRCENNQKWICEKAPISMS